MMKGNEFIIPVGISGSGKSRWILSLDDNYVIISPDNIRRELTGSVSDQTKNYEVHQIAFKRAIAALNAAKNVIFDATNVISRERRDMLKILNESVTVEFTAYAKIFNVDPEICKNRIKEDMDNNVDRSDVPPYAIDRQYRKFIGGLNNIESDGYTII